MDHQEPAGYEPAEHADTDVPWHCICGSGDRGEWHTFMCAAHNTPDDYFYGEPEHAGDATQVDPQR